MIENLIIGFESCTILRPNKLTCINFSPLAKNRTTVKVISPCVIGPFLLCKYKLLWPSLRRILDGCQGRRLSLYHTSTFKRCQKWNRAACMLFAHFTVNCASVCMVILSAVSHRTVHSHLNSREQACRKTKILCKYIVLQTGLVTHRVK